MRNELPVPTEPLAPTRLDPSSIWPDTVPMTDTLTEQEHQELAGQVLTVAVVGLGYVGLPLVVEFGRLGRTIGLDINHNTVMSCRQNIDPSDELTPEHMASARYAEYTTDAAYLSQAHIIIVAVPTPVNNSNQPDFGPLIAASTMIGRYMRSGTIVVYESTVYPGATEEVCIPVLEQNSRLVWKHGFFVGYSPERINPGDKEHSLTNTRKIVSGDTPETLATVKGLYESIVQAGTFSASSIAVAEAAKVIENTQRDLNIALMNELALIFDRLNLDTLEVLEAAGTKWNFLPFRPGLVGGHCIGVDPYYLTNRAEQIGYHPQVILAGRRINDSMGKFVAEQTVKHMIREGKVVRGSIVTVCGLAFKENCSDIRNTRVIDIVHELQDYGCHVQVNDPLVAQEYAQQHYGIQLVPWTDLDTAEALVMAVAHDAYLSMPLGTLCSVLTGNGVFIDVKSRFPAERLRAKGLKVWRL